MLMALSVAARLALLAALAVQQAGAEVLTQAQVCVGALTDIYGEITFDGIGYDDYYVGLCQNPMKVTSVYAAAKVYCSPSDAQSGFGWLSGACEEYGFVSLLPESDFSANLTDEAIRSMPVLAYADIDPTVNITEPIMISQDFFDTAYHTEDDWDFEMRTHTNYGWAMYGFWGSILLFGMIRRLAAVFFEKRLAASTSSVPRTFKPVVSLYSWARKFVIVPSSFPPYHRHLFLGCTIPTRIETFVVSAYWIISFVLCGVNFRAFEGNFFYADIPTQLWRYIADRTGIISYANLPIIWMFSGRNNIFLWMTGWSFSTFNMFHRHIARIATLQAIMHSVGYTAFYFTGGYGDDYKEEFQEPWWYLGVVATISLSFLVLFSFSWFRRKIYESFLLIHIILSVVVIVALFYHTSIFEGEYDPYLWPLVGIWSFDRLLRIIRVLYCNVHVSLQKGKTLHRTKAVIAYDRVSNMLRIDVIPASQRPRPGPGQHYYLYQPFTLTGWENHPFTLASWTGAGSGHSEELVLTFWVRPFDGWTRKLRKRCERSSEPAVETTLLLEGPYGHPEPLWTFEEVLLITGGSGVAAIVPYILDHIRRTSQTPSSTRTRSITVVWADRSESMIQTLAAGPLAEALARQDVNMSFYCSTTAADSSSSGSSSPRLETSPSKEVEAGALSKELRISQHAVGATGAAIQRGRPNIPTIVAKAAADARGSASRLAVMCCGPPKMADQTRDAVSRSMDKYTDSVQYFEEAFGW